VDPQPRDTLLGRVEAGATTETEKDVRMGASATLRRLDRDISRLRHEVERYRLATEAGLESLDAAIGWLDRSGRTGLARDLRRNRASIRRNLQRDTRP
jgi:hypothetical protein